MNAVATVDPILLKPEEAGEVLRIGRTKAYEWIKAGVMPGVVRPYGGSIRVNYEILKEAMRDETLRQAAEAHAERERLRRKLGLTTRRAAA